MVGIYKLDQCIHSFGSVWTCFTFFICNDVHQWISQIACIKIRAYLPCEEIYSCEKQINQLMAQSHLSGFCSFDNHQYRQSIFHYQSAYMIFTRKIFSENQTEIFFFFLISFLILKFYLLNQYSTRSDIMAQRSKKKVQQILFQNTFLHNNNNEKFINTDIINVSYDQSSLKRQLPKIKKANVQLNTNKNKQDKINSYFPIK